VSRCGLAPPSSGKVTCNAGLLHHKARATARVGVRHCASFEDDGNSFDFIQSTHSRARAKQYRSDRGALSAAFQENGDAMTTTNPGTIYPRDSVLLDNLSADDRSDFKRYMDELDAEHARIGCPYGDGSLWQLTGAECWYSYFEDGFSAASALVCDDGSRHASLCEAERHLSAKLAPSGATKSDGGVEGHAGHEPTTSADNGWPRPAEQPIAEEWEPVLKPGPSEPSPAASGTTEYGWLIEMGDPPVYHIVSTQDYDRHWTPDANKALRFARREDAQAYSDHVGWTSPPVRVVEHGWIAPSDTRPEVETGPVTEREYASSNVELDSPYGFLNTIYGNIENGRKGYIIQRDVLGAPRVKFANLDFGVAVPQHWLKKDTPTPSVMPDRGGGEARPIGYISPSTKRALIDPHGAGPIVAAAGYDTTIPVYLATPLATEGAEAVAYLHDLQPFAEDEALAVCNKVDPGAFPVYTHPPRAPDREKLLRLLMDWSARSDTLPPFYQKEGEELADKILTLFSKKGE